jgi:hypothetical protein
MEKRMFDTATQSNGNGSAPPPVLTKAQTEERRRMGDWLEKQIKAGESAHIVTLTPALAVLLLERNPINRPISPRNSAFIASDIANGRWEFNGESIVVSNTGMLIDGQHRCHQVISTGKAIRTTIVFGPKEKARFTIDTGRPKTASNFLAMQEYKYTHVLSAAVGYHLQWRHRGFITTKGTEIPTTQEKLAAIEEMQGIEKSAEFTSGCMKTVGSHAVLTFSHFVFWKKAGREAADHFIGKVIDGDGLRKGDPILYCRNRLLGMRNGIDANTRVELMFKCWNAHRMNQGIDHFKLSGGKLPKVER